MSEMHAAANSVPSSGRHDLILVDGRTFAISDERGDMWMATHGLVHDDLRHLSHLTVGVQDAIVDLLASSTPSPLSSVVVSRVHVGERPSVHLLLVRRRWIAGGLREEITLTNPHPVDYMVTLLLTVGADFAHVFDVKAGLVATTGVIEVEGNCWRLRSPHHADDSSIVDIWPPAHEADPSSGEQRWTLRVPARDEVRIVVTVEPVSSGVAAGLAFPQGVVPGEPVAIRRLGHWYSSVPRVVSIDPRLPIVVDQALADIAALRIVDRGHVDRAVVAAGAPWFMTLFGRDSLLTSWMTLPFDSSLAPGVLASLADLQGTVDDPLSEEQPGKILHELRRHGGDGPFATRSRYYGTVDATPLFVAVAAEAWRWGALDDRALAALAPAIRAALGWLIGPGDSDGDGFIDYHRRDARGLVNQGWKDSWDGVTFADGTFPSPPIALAEVQGYAYLALLGGAILADNVDLGYDPADLRHRAERLRERFNEAFWDAQRGWFVMGLDGDGRPIDSLTTNPGHALWCGIAEPDKAARFVERLMDASSFTGWGLRTLADSMAAYDPLSYHNGSVWPHDTAICAAGAARYGCWDAVDRIVDGAFEAAMQFDGRPPELFSGVARSDVPIPVAYPSSCSPQAWSSASVLLLIRSMLGLEPSDAGDGIVITRPDLGTLPDMVVERLHAAGRAFTVTIRGGRGTVRHDQELLGS